MEAQINAFAGEPKTPNKRVLFVVTQSEFGGAQQFLYAVLSRLVRGNYELLVAAGGTGDGAFLRAIEGLGIKTTIIPGLQRDGALLGNFSGVSQVRSVIKKFRPDTLYLGSSKAGFVGALAARFSSPRPKVIYRIGGWSFNDPVSNLQRAFRRWLEKLSAGWKDIIIVNNSHDLEQAKELGIQPRQKLVLVHNGIDPYKVSVLPREEARLKLFEIATKTSGAETIIGTIANFYPAKGLEYLIEAAVRVDNPKAVFFIIGDGPERANLEQRIKENNLEKKVILLGRIEEASRYLSAFDIFVLPSVKEGFPWAVLEAMSAKLPVVATRVGAIPEIIEDGISGSIVPPRNADQLATAIIKIIDNESLAREMGIQAHQRVLFSFSFEKMIEQIEALL